MYDLHLHSICSDGDLSPEEVVHSVYEKGLSGFSLTDHNGIWGLSTAATAAQQYKLEFLSGIEISTSYQKQDVHILGFATEFKQSILNEGLATTKAGCRQRIEAMVQKCHTAGFSNVSMQSIEERYTPYKDPSFISFDVARQLQQKHNLSVAEAHKMTIFGGACYVPYGDWLMAPQEAIALLHSAGGVAVLAHPGISMAENDEAFLTTLLQELTRHHLDGLEIRHPFHKPELVERLSAYATEHNLLITAGSDWHGPSRFPENNVRFGHIGLTQEEWTTLLTRCAEMG